MAPNDLIKLDTPAIREYTQRQNVALMALRGLLYSTHNDLSKYATIKEVNIAFGDILYSIGSIYKILLDNIEDQERYSTLHGLEDYAQINNVALMALDGTIKREASLQQQTDKEDGILALELLLYDLKSIYSMLSNNMETLWEIKDRTALAA